MKNESRTLLTLLVDLRNDSANTVVSFCSHHFSHKPATPLMHDGVALISDSALLFDRTKAHKALVQVCAILEEKKWPYLLVHIESTASLLAGKPSEEVLTLLASAGVPCSPQT